MKFISTVGRYTVGTHPDHYEQVGQGRLMVKGLHAQFKNGIFDSVEEQKRLHWSDDQREIVEDWLLGHKDFGTASGDTLRVYDPEAQPTQTVTLLKGQCLFTSPIEEDGVRSTVQC